MRRTIKYVLKRAQKFGDKELPPGTVIAEQTLARDLPNGCDHQWLDQAKKTGLLEIDSHESTPAKPANSNTANKVVSTSK